MAGILYPGIDVSMEENTCCFLFPNGSEARRRLTVTNNLPGAQVLIEEILQLMERHHLDRLLVGLEATNVYWWHLACLLDSLPPSFPPSNPRSMPLIPA